MCASSEKIIHMSNLMLSAEQEAERLEALREYGLLDTPPESCFDELTQLAAEICDAPVALVSLVDADRQWFKSRVGLEIQETGREVSFCAHAIQSKEIMVVPDAREDARFAGNPLVQGDPNIRFYAGMPLVGRDGLALGTLCVIDLVVRDLQPHQLRALKVLGRQVMAQMELRKNLATLAEGQAAKIENRVQKRSAELALVARESSDKLAQADRARLALLSLLEDQKRAESALQQSEERFRLMVETVQEVFWITSPNKDRIIYVSPAYEPIWGRTCASLYLEPHTWLDSVHEEDRERVRLAAQTKQVIGAYDVEFRIKRPDGSLRWIRDRAFPVKESSGQLIQVIGVAQDITDYKLAEQALSENRHFLEKAQEVGNIGSWISAPDALGELRWSLQTYRIFGLDPATRILVETFFSLVHPDDRKAVEAASKSALDGKAEFNIEHRIVRPDRSIRWVHEQANVEWAADGTPLRMIGVVQDITERKQLEEQLRQSQKMEAIGHLAGGVAHDFNNILTVIQGHASMLEMREQLPEEIQESVSQIAEASKRAANLTRQLLTFSRRQLMQPVDLDLREVVSQMTRMLHRILGEDIKLQVESTAGLPRVYADTGMMEQVVLNLAVNARDAMPKGGSLRIRTSCMSVAVDESKINPEAMPGLTVCLSVEDSGCGIPAQILSRIFDPFFTTKEVGKGTGLGLATVYGIVKQHHGWITVKSELGKGTMFEVYLPASKTASHENTTPNIPTVIRGGSETILLVEDEDVVRRLTKLALQRQGYRVLEAANGVAALAIWREHHQDIQLLLTDVVMPEQITGLELAKMLLLERPDLKTLFVSGYSVDLFGKDLNLAAGQHFLQKPYQLPQLFNKVRECLDERLGESAVRVIP
jgi:two-component system, cell cycle sensor histidine kinase and response regulator CckA